MCVPHQIPRAATFLIYDTLIFGIIKYTLKDDTLIYDIPGPPPPGSPAIRSRPRHCPTTSYIQKESTRLERNTPYWSKSLSGDHRPRSGRETGLRVG